MAKVSRPVVYGGVLLLAVAGFLLTEPPAKSGVEEPKRSRRGSSSSKKAVPEFTEEDYTARFAALNEQPKNAFKPLVARLEQGIAGGGLAPNEFPASYTGGEAGWFYTGTVIVDDVPSALVENQVTGEGMFLKVGGNVKNAVIAQIAPTYIVVKGATGQSLRLDLLRDLPEPEDEFAGLAVEPVRPNVAGLEGPVRAPGVRGRELPGMNEQQ